MASIQLEKIVGEAVQILVDDLKKEVTEQGHVNTGRGRRSIRFELKELAPGDYEATVYWLDYMSILDAGVSAQRIPFSPGRRSGARVSKYIQGLINYFRTRGLSGREAKGAAFATATVQSREGMPTRASYRFSNNGRRKGMVEQVRTDTAETIVRFVEDNAARKIQIDLLDTAQAIFS